MLQLIVLVKKSTLLILDEHSVNQVGPAVDLNADETLIMLSSDTLSRILAVAEPGDQRIDDVIARVAL